MQSRAQGAAHRDLLGVDVAAPGLQALDFGQQQLVLLAPLSKRHADLIQLVLGFGVALGSGLAQLAAQLALRQEVVSALHREQPQGAAQFVVAAKLDQAAITLGFHLGELTLQARDAVAAVVADGAAQLLLFEPFIAKLCGQPLDLRRLAHEFVAKVHEPLLQQLGLVHRKESPERLAAFTPLADQCDQLVVPRAVGHHGCEQLDLALGLEHRLVGAVQIVVVRDQRADARRHVEGFEHVAAHELGQVADRLHRHGLVKQLQRLLVVDAEAAPKRRAIRRKAVFDLGTPGTQALAQLGHVGAEVGKVFSDAQRPIRHHVEAHRLAMRLLEPEHLSQRHGLVVAGVVEHTQDHRIAVGLAQRHGPPRAALLVALGLVVAQHIRAQRALARVGPGGLVVGDALGRYEQRGDRIDQGRLARADVAGQQRVAAVGAQRPDTGIKGAPVEDLEPLQAKAGELLVGDEIKLNGFILHCRPRPRVACGRRQAARRTAPTIAHRQKP